MFPLVPSPVSGFKELRAERAKEPVQRQRGFPVVAIKESVMEVVKIRARGQPALEDGAFEPVMPPRRRQGRVLGVEEKMDRVRRHHEVDQDHAEIQEMLHGMHGQPGPRAGVDVLVMQIMHGLVERRPVNGAVDPVEMKFTPEGNGA